MIIKMFKILIILITIFILVNLYLHFSIKKRDIENRYPPNILPEINLDIELPNVEWVKNIPKKIYRTHEDPQRLEPYREVLEKTEKLLPQYETEIFYKEDREKFIKDKYGDRIYNAYMAIDPNYGPAKADFFRYLVVYYYGGIYLDIKSGPVKNLDKILEKTEGRMALSNWTNFPVGILPVYHYNELYWSSFIDSYYGEYQNWFVISGAGNPMLGKIIKQVVSNIEAGLKNINFYKAGHYSVIAMTGPLMITMVIDKYQKEEKDSIIIFKNFLDNHLKYKVIDHKKIEKSKHYSKNKNKNVLKIDKND